MEEIVQMFQTTNQITIIGFVGGKIYRIMGNHIGKKHGLLYVDVLLDQSNETYL